MKTFIISFILSLVCGIAYAKPHCQGFNNYDNKVSIVFTDDNADIVDEMSLDKSSVAIENLDSPLNSPWFESVLKTIVRKRYETKCQILRNIFAVSIEGDIYPCHMNVGDGMLPVSSIWDSGQELQDAIRHNIAYRLKDNNTCNQCKIIIL